MCQKQTKKLYDARCFKCNKLLAKVNGEAEIVCPRCGGLNSVNTDFRKRESH